VDWNYGPLPYRESSRASDARVLVVGPLQGMHEEAGWLWTAMLIADAHGQQQAALRLLGAIDARAQRGLQFIEPLRRRCQPVADRLRARIGPGGARRAQS
jgi:hypothetical protein